MADDEDEETTQFHVRQLQECMQLSDPNSANCEYDRLLLAQAAVANFWRIYRCRLVWAGDFILGRLLYRDQLGLRASIEHLIDHDRTDDDYFYEDIGSLFGWNGRRQHVESAIQQAAADAYERKEWEYRSDIKRQFYIEMTMTTVGDATWAKDTQGAMSEVNVGGRPGLFEPTRKVHGDAVALHGAKKLAVAHVRAIHGGGATKLSARLEVGDEIGVSEATLKAWEAELEKDEYISYELHCFELAGAYGDELEAASWKELEDAAGAFYAGASDLVLARHLREELLANPLPQVRKRLRAARSSE